MKLSAQLRRVEKAAGIGQRCLDCRRHYILFADEIKLTPPADLYMTTCAGCDQTLKLIHSGFTERERGVLVAVSGNTFNDSKKWLASYAWTHHLPRFLEVEKIGEAEERRLRDLLHSDNATLRAAARKQVAVLDEYAAHKKAQMARIEKVKERSQSRLQKRSEEKDYDVVLAALDKVRERRREIGDNDLFSYYIMAEMEVFMWSEKSKETLKLIEGRKKFLAEEKTRQQAEEEERQRKREEERRLREEERKRQHEEYLARTRPAQPVPPPPSPVPATQQSDFWNEAALATHDEQGRKRVEIPYISEPKDSRSQPPPDDGTVRYQQKLTHYRQTGVWLPDEWM